MADVVYPSKFQRPSSSESASPTEIAKARKEGFIASRFRERAARANETRAKLASVGRLSNQTKSAFGDRAYLLFKELDDLGPGLVARVLNEVVGEGEKSSTKRRGRFAQKKGEHLGTHLTASGGPWVKLIGAVAELLRRDPDKALIDFVADTEYGHPTANLVVGEVSDDAAMTATHLNILAASVARRYRLADYFTVLSGDDVEVDEGGNIRAALPFPGYANPSLMADGLWMPEEEGAPPLFPLLPKVKVQTVSRSLNAEGTLAEIIDLPDGDVGWDAVAQRGTEQMTIEASASVWLGIAPIGQNGAPAACFFIKPQVDVLVWHRVVTNIGYCSQRKWQDFSAIDDDGSVQWHAYRLLEAMPDHFLDDVGDTFDAFLTVSVSAQSCMRYLADRDFDGVPEIDGEKGLEGYDDDPDPEPVTAPRRTVLGAVQRNLAYAPRDKTLSTLLSNEAERLVGSLRELRDRRRDAYERAMAPQVAQWQEDDTQR